MSLAAYLDELRDLPPIVLSHGLQRLVRKGGDFMPSVATIRKECALLLRERHRRALGLDPNGWNPQSDAGEIDAEAWLRRARDPLPVLPAHVAEPEVATLEQRARGSALLAELAAKMGQR